MEGKKQQGRSRETRQKSRPEMEAAWTSLMEKVVVRSEIWHILER